MKFTELLDHHYDVNNFSGVSYLEEGTMEIMFGTNNKQKLQELNLVSKFELDSPDSFGLTVDPEETGNTFKENAIIKAKAFFDELKRRGYDNVAVISEDSGFCVDALGGAPGLYSKRWYPGTPQERRRKILELMEGKKNRKAKFVCSMILILPDGEMKSFEGEMKGTIPNEEGSEGHGYAYDPILIVNGRYVSDMSLEEKGRISHRGIALKKAEKAIEAYLHKRKL